jgi:tetratricopeptide (TPR) repeat protein
MKKTNIYTILLVLFGFFIVLIVARYHNKEKQSYGMLERTGPMSQTKEWMVTRNYATALQESIGKNPADIKANLALAALFIQEARVTGNYSYYDKAAMKYVNNILKMDSANFEAMTFKSLIYLSQHHFADGLTIAEKAQRINPYNAFIYGILVDGNVEMGHYDSAVASADRMVSIRPDLRSYSRISYLREIYGDYPGAVRAMKMAVDAGAPGDEATEWARVQLGHLYEYTGDLRNAAMHYTIALDERPGYAYALAGLGRIELEQKNYGRAIAYYLKADSLVKDYSFKEELVEMYKLSGEPSKADSMSRVVIEGMSRDASSSQQDENLGHYADRELAYAYLKTGNFDKALEHALTEYNRRPGNIDVNETVAWVYYCKGDYVKALPFLHTAMKTKSKNPVLLCHAGLIYAKTGDKAAARSNLQESLQSNPNFAASLKTEGMNTLKSL